MTQTYPEAKPYQWARLNLTDTKAKELING